MWEQAETIYKIHPEWHFNCLNYQTPYEELRGKKPHEYLEL